MALSRERIRLTARERIQLVQHESYFLPVLQIQQAVNRAVHESGHHLSWTLYIWVVQARTSVS